jgi:hypothetical protein
MINPQFEQRTSPPKNRRLDHSSMALQSLPAGLFHNSRSTLTDQNRSYCIRNLAYIKRCGPSSPKYVVSFSPASLITKEMYYNSDNYKITSHFLQGSYKFQDLQDIAEGSCFVKIDADVILVGECLWSSEDLTPMKEIESECCAKVPVSGICGAASNPWVARNRGR